MLLSELEFGAFLSYCPRGDSELARESRKWMRALKSESLTGQPPTPMSKLVATRLCSVIATTPLASILTPTATLVPVPRSSKAKPGDLWVPHLVANELHVAGLGREVWPCLQRRSDVRKSATARPIERPKASEHYESFAIERRWPEPDEFVLVDDVVTRGATLIGAASRLRDAFPRATVRAFVVMRTISDPEDFKSIRDSVVGTIRLSNEETFRQP